jgi:hypothetical protein
MLLTILGASASRADYFRDQWLYGPCANTVSVDRELGAATASRSRPLPVVRHGQLSGRPPGPQMGLISLKNAVWALPIVVRRPRCRLRRLERLLFFRRCSGVRTYGLLSGDAQNGQLTFCRFHMTKVWLSGPRRPEPASTRRCFVFSAGRVRRSGSDVQHDNRCKWRFQQASGSILWAKRSILARPSGKEAG